MKRHDTPTTTHRIEISGPLDRRDVEMLQLEIRRLAKLKGVDVARVQIQLLCDDQSEAP